jgi:hypothetical protein
MLLGAPARQSASALHISTSSRSNVGDGGVNGASLLGPGSWLGKNVSWVLCFPIREILARFALLRFHLRRNAYGFPPGAAIKMVTVQEFFKFPLS